MMFRGLIAGLTPEKSGQQMMFRMKLPGSGRNKVSIISEAGTEDEFNDIIPDKEPPVITLYPPDLRERNSM